MNNLLIGLTLYLAAFAGSKYLNENWSTVRTWKEFVTRYWAGWNIFLTGAFGITFILCSFLGVVKF